MAIVEKDGFKFYDSLNSEYIVIESDRINSYLDYICNNNIKSIALNNFFYKIKDLDFLNKCVGIEKVNISSGYVNDYSGLYEQSMLQTLYLDEPRGKIDLAQFPRLKELSIESNKYVHGIEECKGLKILRLWKYKPKSNNLEGISRLTQIEELVLTQSQISSLKGCEELYSLKKLELNYINKLEMIDGIDKNASTLKSLRFESCKNIKNHNYVAYLKELELLAFDNCGNISSVRFIRELPKLKSFIFMNTNVVDGDLSPCIGLEYVVFLDKRHYSHKSVDFKK